MRRNKLAVYVHFVWATVGREPIITLRAKRPLYRYITGVCRNLDCPVVALGGTQDHVHLLVSMCATKPIARLVESVKGSSSRYVGEVLNLDEPFAWQGRYGAFSVSPRDKKGVIDYIRTQETRHAENRIWRHAEGIED